MRLARDRTLYQRFRLGRRIQARVALALAVLLGLAAVVWPGGTATGSEDTGAIQPGELAGLTLVYVDTSHGEGVDLWTAAFDGEKRGLIARFPLGARVLDMDGPLVAVDLAGRLLLVDLRTGEQQELDVTGQLRSALVRADGTVFYTTGREQAARRSRWIGARRVASSRSRLLRRRAAAHFTT